jgi:hypothetical protein
VFPDKLLEMKRELCLQFGIHRSFSEERAQPLRDDA